MSLRPDDVGERGVYAASSPISLTATVFQSLHRNRTAKRRERRAPVVVVVSGCALRVYPCPLVVKNSSATFEAFRRVQEYSGSSLCEHKSRSWLRPSKHSWRYSGPKVFRGKNRN